MRLEGEVNLKDILEKAGVAHSVSVDPIGNLFSLVSKFSLYGIGDEAELRVLLDLLRSHVVIDLTPLVDERHALAPFTVADIEGGGLGRSRIGELVNHAKYHSDRAATDQLGHQMANFVTRHPTYSKARFIVAVPPSSHGSADLPSRFLNAFTDKTIVQASKTRYTQPQKELLAARDESALKANIGNSVNVGINWGGRYRY